MKMIALLALTAIVLMNVLGSKSSVGGPMADLLVSFAVMLAVGMHEAWGRGPVDWLVYGILAVIGGAVALSLTSLALEATVSALHFQGRLATLNHSLRNIADVVMPLATILGAWLPLQLWNRLRPAQ